MTKLYKTSIFIIALAVLGTCVCTLKGQAQNLPEEKAYLRSKEKQIDEANSDLDRVYQKILALLNSRVNAGEPIAKTVKDSLVKAERTWIQWRDAEALWRAYAGWGGRG